MAPAVALVTGARGFAGGHLADLLERCGDTVIRWGRGEVDLLDRQAVAAALRTVRPAVVFHCAGAANVKRAFDDVAGTMAVNAMGTHHLLDGLRRAGLRTRVVVTGTSLVYRQSTNSLAEDAPLGPATPYAVSKLAQEMLALRAIAEDGQDVVVARSFNHTGPRQDPSYVAPAFARQIALIERGRLPPEIVVGNLDASRDLHDVRDTVRAYQALATRGRTGRVYNVCSGRGVPIREVLDRLVFQSRVKVGIRVDPSLFRPSDNPMVVGDSTRIREEIGWAPEISLDATLRTLLDYWRQEVE
jgi:GDP-4-dehydro-6-deoxy-D-mannose reductase